MTSVCSVCKKKVAKLMFCSICKDINTEYSLCSKECQKADWKRHKEGECLHKKFKSNLDRGYSWHLEDIEKKNSELGEDEQVQPMKKGDWMRTAFSICCDWDKKILYEHGFAVFLNGKREPSFLNVQYHHVCDAICRWELDKMGVNPAPLWFKGTVAFCSNMLDGLSSDQISFAWDNRDFLWYSYHDCGSRIPIFSTPNSERVKRAIGKE